MDLSPEQYRELYSAAPDDFLAVRSQLADRAKAAGDTGLAKQIAATRKPTAAAWIVNRQVHHDPDAVLRLVELGARLRTAHADLDAAALRNLSAERRQVVAELTEQALDAVGRGDAPTTLRDDVSGTFDAAVADPRIAEQLGRLARPQRWSGFGVAEDVPNGAPELTVIRGGRDRATTPARTPPAAGDPPAPRVDPAARRRARRARDKAQQAFDTADAALQDSEDAVHAADTRARDLGGQLTRIQAELETVQRDLERARREVKSARNRRREARTALDRAERQVDRPTRGPD